MFWGSELRGTGYATKWVSFDSAVPIGHPVFWMTGICEYATKWKIIGLLEACLKGTGDVLWQRNEPNWKQLLADSLTW